MKSLWPDESQCIFVSQERLLLVGITHVTSNILSTA